MYGSLGSKLAIDSFSMYSALESAAVAGRTEKRTELLIVRTTSTLRLWECIFALFHVAPPPVFHLNFCSYRELRSIFDSPNPQKLRRIQNFRSKIEKKSNYAQLLCKCLFLNAPFVWEFCPFVYREMSIFRMISNFKKPISATFSPISPCLSAPALFPFQGASFANDIPLKIPSFPLFIHSFRGYPLQPNFQAKPTGRFSCKTLHFF